MKLKTQLGVMYRREQDPIGLIEDAKRAEALGFDQFWIVEDCFYMGGISQAAIALTATSTLKVGIGINPGVAHNAAILALEYATLARAFPGRLIGGIGHGVDVWMEQIGEKVASPLTAIEEITTAVRDLLLGKRLTVDGRYVKLRDVILDPPPAVVPPILLGVRARKSMQLAGRISDGVLLAENAAPEYVSWSRDLLNINRSDPGHVAVYTHGLINNDDPAAALATMRRVVADANNQGVNVATEPLSYAAELQALVDKGGEAELLKYMPDAWVRDLSVVGSAEEGQTAINTLAKAGADSVIFVPMGDWNWSEWVSATAKVIS